ncbi:hypothetical protein RHMOL_Rhmol04G0128700 [Rhododendron molle]|uniref:Uncharacterized protein n=1 Tax=Rhododendron molle TaxID=49168 RepID=A0ACC0NZY8_RHOML|nr:hypothetical protein RHMOL_Rhmol04G0128700 [Rhododendron molle]
MAWLLLTPMATGVNARTHAEKFFCMVLKKVRSLNGSQASNHGRHGMTNINSVGRIELIKNANQVMGIRVKSNTGRVLVWIVEFGVDIW